MGTLGKIMQLLYLHDAFQETIIATKQQKSKQQKSNKNYGKRGNKTGRELLPVV